MYRVDRGVQSLCRRSRRTAPNVAHGHAGWTRARRDPRVAGKTYPATPPPLPPSPAGLGIAMVLPGSNCVALFPDAAIAAGLRRNRPALAEKTRVPVASGLSTGDGLMGSASYS